jgi:chlorophyll(ide) b reductase
MMKLEARPGGATPHRQYHTNTKTRPLRVVVTGGSRGLGKALAREFLAHGDEVVIAGRTPEALACAAKDIRAEADALKRTIPRAVSAATKLHWITADVTDADDVSFLAEQAWDLLGGGIDAWICNAGCNAAGYRSLADTPASLLASIVGTNLLGTLLCCRAATNVMAGQNGGGGHVFLVDGAGSDGWPTPLVTAYGATKAAVPQLASSLRREYEDAGVDLGVHVLSPGLVMTDLLTNGSSQQHKRAFDILAEHPETAAAYLVTHARSAVENGRKASYTRFLTPMSALWRMMRAPWRLGRFFGPEGEPTYPSERERFCKDKHAHATSQGLVAVRRRARRECNNISM